MRKKLGLALCIGLALGFSSKAQEVEEYRFETIIDLPATPVKDQFRSGTCWSFSGLSFLESEMIRMGKPATDLSEIFVVRHCYADKAQKYVRLHGALNFGPGGAFHDVTYVLNTYGLVPESAYAGLQYGEDAHVHGELDDALKAYADAILKNSNKKLSTAWLQGINGILDAYLGKLPDSFEVDGKSYTPQRYAKEATGLQAENYVQLTSYTHHPYYSSFALEIPDNWLWGTVYNVPLDELMQVCESALREGYTLGWAADVSEKGFSHRYGVAIVPDTNEKEMSGTERSRWESMSKEAKQQYGMEHPVKEMTVSQELRQEGFDNYLTTDDHGLHITGLAKDQYGNLYFKTKNSWNTDSKHLGYLYVSVPYMRYKTMSVMLHKEALPKALKKRLGIQ